MSQLILTIERVFSSHHIFFGEEAFFFLLKNIWEENEQSRDVSRKPGSAIYVYRYLLKEDNFLKDRFMSLMPG